MSPSKTCDGKQLFEDRYPPIIAGAMALIIALSTIGYQAIRAAIANPVKSLRSE